MGKLNEAPKSFRQLTSHCWHRAPFHMFAEWSLHSGSSKLRLWLELFQFIPFPGALYICKTFCTLQRKGTGYDLEGFLFCFSFVCSMSSQWQGTCFLLCSGTCKVPCLLVKYDSVLKHLSRRKKKISMNCHPVIHMMRKIITKRM